MKNAMNLVSVLNVMKHSSSEGGNTPKSSITITRDETDSIQARFGEIPVRLSENNVRSLLPIMAEKPTAEAEIS